MGGDDGPSLGVNNGMDNKEDDAVDSGSLNTNGTDDVKVIVPNISIKSEFPSVRRNAKGKQSITAMVTIEVPPAMNRGYYSPQSLQSRREASSGGELSPQLPPSPHSTASFRESMMAMSNGGGTSHFANLEMDLRERVEDYAASGIPVMGHLKLYDILKVRKREMTGELQLYLFDHGLVCISEERRSSALRSLFGNHRQPNDRSRRQGKTFLKVRGRVHMHHILNIQDTSTNSEYVLTLEVETEDEGHHLFHIYFRDSGSLEMWKGTMRRLRDECLTPHLAAAKTSKLTGVSMVGRSPRALPITPMASSFTEFIDSCASTCGPQCPGELAFQIPLAPKHTPIDLVIAISTVAAASGSGGVRHRQRQFRKALQCALACLGPRDRIAFVATEFGPNSVVRRTPLLNATSHDSRIRLESFIDILGMGRLENDEFETEIQRDEKPDVATAVNIALDVILSRKSKNALSSVMLISDLPEATSRNHMGMVNARLDAAQ